MQKDLSSFLWLWTAGTGVLTERRRRAPAGPAPGSCQGTGIHLTLSRGYAAKQYGRVVRATVTYITGELVCVKGTNFNGSGSPL